MALPDDAISGPLTWEIRGGVLIITVVGEYDFQGFARLVDEVKSDPQYRAGLSLRVA